MKQVRILDTDEISGLSGLIRIPVSRYSLRSPDQISSAIFSEIHETACGKDNFVAALDENGTITAFGVCKKAEVESEVFRKRVFSLSCLVSGGRYRSSVTNKTRLLRFLKSGTGDCIDMLSCRVSAGDHSSIHALEGQAFRHMDSLVTYTAELPCRTDRAAHPFCSARLFRDRDLPEIRRIAQCAFSLDRYHTDPRIPKEQSDELYGRFAENAARGIGADTIMVAVHRNRVIGFNTMDLNNHNATRSGVRIASFVLNAVSPEYRNRGVYTGLIHESLRYCNGKADYVEIRTHIDNYPVHRVLPGFGFRATASYLTFHRWNSGERKKPRIRGSSA